MEWFDPIAKRAQSPRGKMADKEAIYQELCQHLDIQKAETHPAIKPWWRRAAVAACALFVIGIGIAGIYQYQVTEDKTESVTEVTNSATQKALTPLVFNNQPVSQIAQTLAKQFNTSIVVQDATLAQYRMTASFAANESLPEILSALASAGHFHFIKTNQGYSLIP